MPGRQTVTVGVTVASTSLPSVLGPFARISRDLTPNPMLFCLPNSRGGKDPLSSPGGPGSRRNNYNLGKCRSIWKNLDERVRVWARAPRATLG